MEKKLKTFSICGLSLLLLAGCGQHEANNSSSASHSNSAKVENKHSHSHKKDTEKKSSLQSEKVHGLQHNKNTDQTVKQDITQAATKAKAASTTEKSLLMPQLQGIWYHVNDEKSTYYSDVKGLLTLKIEGNTITDITPKGRNVFHVKETPKDPTANEARLDHSKEDEQHADWVVVSRNTNLYGLKEDMLWGWNQDAGHAPGYSTTTLNINGKPVEVLVVQAWYPGDEHNPAIFYRDKALAEQQKDNTDFPIFQDVKTDN